MTRPRIRYQGGMYYCYQYDCKVVGIGGSMPSAYLDFLRDRDRYIIQQLEQAAEDERTMECILMHEGKIPSLTVRKESQFPDAYIPQMVELPDYLYDPQDSKRWWQIWK